MTACLPFVRPLILGLALLAGVSGLGASCRADLVLELNKNVTATAGSTGSFDVLVVNTDPSTSTTSYHLSSDSVKLALAGLSGVSFTSATIATTGIFNGTAYSYIYQQTGTTASDPLSYDPFPNTLFTASDSEFASPYYRSVGAGSVFGLVHVGYTASASASAGTGSISFQDVGAGTSLSDENGKALAFTTKDGTFTVAAVPEPGSLLLGLIGFGTGGLAHLWRRGRRSHREKSGVA
jgi:hypothetical protein